jgi:hypothetical protein
MRYEVPQFIDVEDHIIGSLTLAQFLYIAGGGGGGYIMLRFLPPVLNVIGAIVVLGFGLALAFFRINGRPFPVMLFAILSHFLSPRMFLWSYKRAMTKKNRDDTQIKQFKSKKKAGLTDQRLSDISWSLDIMKKK